MRTFYVYIMASRSRVLYVGVTNDLARRVREHRQSTIPGFTTRYRVSRLAYFERFVDIRDAIAREKEIKGWVRSRKVLLIDRHPERSARNARAAKDLLLVARMTRRR
ncbi:MAG TPA: GIY-YIG nuclease family protein [Gemmatimonadales bacterium]|nr:GIY-YIG nuclease family protein [Gemmatimonadales bacterium]